MDWKKLFNDEILHESLGYITENRYKDLKITDDELTVRLFDKKENVVKITYKDGAVQDMQCSCPYASMGIKCEHMAAACYMGEVRKNAHNASITLDEEKNLLIDKTKNQVTVNIEESNSEYALKAEVNDYYCYALQQNGGIPLVKNIVVANLTDKPVEDLILKIETDTELIQPYSKYIEQIGPQEGELFESVDLIPQGSFLANVEETVKCYLKISVMSGGDILIYTNTEITVIPYNQWPGTSRYTPDLLSAFILPNHPAVAMIDKRASQLLKDWTGDDSLADYQDGKKERIVNIAKAIYTAIQEQNISYITVPPSFEDDGQKIRFPDDILNKKMGTCMDMTTFYLACLEYAGINSIAVLIKGHIFSALWLISNGNFGSYMTNDSSKLLKLSSPGVNEVLLVESTKMCTDMTFEEATEFAKGHIAFPEGFDCAIDITRTRLSGIKPIPYRVKNAEGYVIEVENRDMSKLEGRKDIDISTVDLSDVNTEKQKMTKQLQWERKLLDLSTSNILVNTRFKAVIPIITSSVYTIEDELSEDKEFTVMPMPDEWKEHGFSDDYGEYELITNHDKYAELIEKDIKSKILHAYRNTEDRVARDMKRLYRASTTLMEETGANSMYMAVGMLRWFDDRGKVAHYAPILLVPVDIVRQSAAKGVTVKRRDDETIINITLLELLKEAFAIEVPGLNELPQDEHGVDVKKIFAILNKAIVDKKDWEIIECCAIGVFSFAKFIMWNDIHSHPGFLEHSKIVSSLIAGEVKWDTTIPEKVNTDNPYLPVSVDASQLRAINMAANGVSFVLHGPPGTGKSQTITAMIANALTKGKSVLFVAEKEAALNVVRDRLDQVGIGDFCLELHSHKATKRSVLDQIAKVLELSVWGMSTDYEKRVKELAEKKAPLDEYANTLHRKLECGMSVRQLIDVYESLPDTDVRVKLTDETVNAINTTPIDDLKRFLESLVIAGKTTGHPHDHMFKYVMQTEYTQSLRMKLEDEVYEFRSSINSLKDSVDEIRNSLNIAEPKTYAEWVGALELANAVLASKDCPAFLFTSIFEEDPFTVPIKYVTEKAKCNQTRSNLLNIWKEEFLSKDMNSYISRFQEAQKKLVGKQKAVDTVVDEVSAYSKTGNRVANIEGVCKVILSYQNMNAVLKQLESKLTPEWKELIVKYPTADALTRFKQEALTKQKSLEKHADAIKTIKSGENYDKAYEAAEKLRVVLAKMLKEEKDITDMLMIKPDTSSPSWLDSKLEECDQLDHNSTDLRNWINYQSARKACTDAGLAQICEIYEEGLDHDKVIPMFLKTVYKTLIWNAIESNPILNRFTGTTFNEQVRQFKEFDDEFIKITREEMYYKLTHNLPTGRESENKSKEMAILRRAIKSGGRGVSIRSLFEQAPHMIHKCCPCMLMSPMSVAQYLAPQNDLFDLVIFDEASQLPTCDAVGVIARGKDAVIAGDPNQMPPTSFFSGKYEDVDNIDLEDQDSILDDCQVIGMPDTHLQWHYRSRHESLIAFSNNNYYDNGMLTFPSVNDAERRVSLIKVNGRKVKNKNEREAHKVVEEVLRRYNDEELRKQSIGIVTFNVSQQRLIEDLLDEEYKKDPGLDAWAHPEKDKLIVKNLENIQGDERDVILFSVTFGLDEDDKLSLNFGPLNKDGGWKRLNVAISRARQEMVVFASMDSSMIDSKRPSSKGVLGVRNFLFYAETGRLPNEYASEDSNESEGIKKQICEAIKDKGYDYKTDVGHSNFRVDIAVVNPDDPDEYLLGILLDGDSYKLSTNTRDREVSQMSVLKSLGWSIHRIWTMDWWDDKEREINEVVKLLEELRAKHIVTHKSRVLPESEELSPISTSTETKRKKKTVTVTKKVVKDFSQERFTPSRPHADSFEEDQEADILKKLEAAMAKNEFNSDFDTESSSGKESEKEKVTEENKDE